jgi:p-aminobenzoyl-glutamate transporter AbgT
MTLAEVFFVLAVALVAGAIGITVGILVVAPRVRRWADRQEEAEKRADGGPDR